MPGNSGHHQSDEKKSGSDGGHHIPHETRGPGWRTWVACTQLPGGRAMPGKGGHHQSDEREREAVMVATTYPMKPGALGKNLGDLHLMKRRKSHAWRQWPSPARWKRREAVMVAHHMPHETRGPGWRTWVAYTQLQGGRAMPGNSGHHQSDGKKGVAVMVATTHPMKPWALGKNLGGPHSITRRKSHPWKQLPSPVR